VLTLPAYHTRRAWLRAFWLVQSATASLLLWAALAAASRPGAGALVVFALLAAPGLVWPHAMAKPYRAYNFAVRRFAELSSSVVTRVCLWGIFPAVGMVGSQMKMKPDEAAGFGWAPREAPAGGSAPELQNSDWLASFLAWSGRNDNRWSLALLPFLLLLALLEEDPEEETLEHDVYTLY
jgi:hypothetical protein